MSGRRKTARASARTCMFLGALSLIPSVGCATSVEVDVQEVEVTWRGVTFSGYPVLLPNGLLETSHSCELDSTNASWAKQLDANVRTMSVGLHATQGIPSLDFIQTLVANMSSSSDPANVIPIAAYERPADAPSSPDLEAASPQPVDVTGVWSGDRTKVDLFLIGPLPTFDWAVDVTLRLSGQINGRL
jgi:hypothetical protein